MQRDISLSNIDRMRRLEALKLSPFLSGGSSFFADNDREASIKSAYINREASFRIKQYRLGFNDLLGTVLGGALGIVGRQVAGDMTYKFGSKLRESLEKKSSGVQDDGGFGFYNGADRMLSSGYEYRGYYNPLVNDSLKGVLDIKGY